MGNKTSSVHPHRAAHCSVRLRFIAVCGLAAAGQIALSGAVWSAPMPGKPLTKALPARLEHAPLRGALFHLVQMVNSDFTVMNVSGVTDEPLPLKIALPVNPNGNYSFLMFRGLPPKFSLSSGFATKSQWAVSLNELNGLRIIPSPGYTGSFNLEVLLMKSKEGDPERRTVRVEFVPTDALPPISAAVSQPAHPSSGQIGASVASAPSQPTASSGTLPSPREMDDDDRLMLQRGDLLFRQGDVAAARLIYNRMAKQGIAAAALAMGRTYDAEVLKPLKVEGLQPDAAQARVWYKLAADLGNQQAKNRLLTLRETQ